MTPRLFHRLRNRALNVAIGCVVGGSLGLTAQADLPPGTLVGSGSGQIVSIDPATGDRTLISGPARGSGPALSGRPSDLVIEPSGDIVVADFDGLRALVRIDVDTGDRTVLASETVGSGGPFRAGTVEIDADGSLIVFNTESTEEKERPLDFVPTLTREDQMASPSD